MARINTNVPALVAVADLKRNSIDLNQSMRRLSSGLRINRGADDPAGLIASETLRSEMSSLTQAIQNSERAANVIATAEGALNEINALLISIQGKIVQAANTGAMSPTEIRANQLQVDSAVDSITRIANSTTFAGLSLLNGNLDYISSGVDSSLVTNVQIFGVQFGTNETMPVDVNVFTSAQQAGLEFRNSQITQTVSVEIAGNQGVETFTFISGTAASAVMFAVNRSVDATGVQAELINDANAASGITFQSLEHGSSQFVSVQSLSGTFDVVDAAGDQRQRDVGDDAIASVNGAVTVGDGLVLTLNTTSLDLELTLDGDFGTGTTRFDIVAGGALFQLGGNVDGNEQVNIGIKSVAASKLGSGTTGYMTDIVTGGRFSLVADEAGVASDIVAIAVSQISMLRGRLGAFEMNTLQTNISSLQVALENVTSSESAIRDTDFAMETARMTRAQILVSANMSVLGVANQNPQAVLSLLG